MRILYDTNVLVTLVSRREAVLRLKKQFSAGQDALIVSGYMLNEVEDVLGRFKLTRQRVKAAIRHLERIAQIVEPSKVEKVCRDPDDDNILAAALAGKADYIVTTDKDLLVLRKYKGIQIITPTDLRKIFG